MMTRILRQAFQTRALPAVLAVVLLAAQAIVAVHDADVEAHEANHACEVCVSASALGGGNIGAATAFTFIAADRSIDPAAAPVFATTQRRAASARAPPAIS